MHALKAGALNTVFQPEDGWLRYLESGGTEWIRAIYVAVRDRQWKTVPPVIEDLAITESSITFTATCDNGDVRFRWHGRIESGDDQIRYHMSGEALEEFEANRVGFCVLHPLAFAGHPVLAVHTDGSTEEGVFPYDISPDQPFLDIRSLTTEVEGAECRVELTGDTFEMEDQRNWGDASFKTYCRPQELPKPFKLAQGDRVEQEVRVVVRGSGNGHLSGEVTITLEETALGSVPSVGLSGDIHAAAEAGLRHVRIDVDLDDEDFAERVRPKLEELKAAGLELEIGLKVGNASDACLIELPALLKDLDVAPARCVVLDEAGGVTPLDAIERARRCLACPVLGGSPHNFTEVNRSFAASEVADGVFFAANPQVHATDARTVFENLEGLEQTIRNAARISLGKPVAVSPLDLSRGEDPKLTTPLAGVWALGAVRAAAHGGASSITFGQLSDDLLGGLGSASLSEVERVYRTDSSRSYLAEALLVGYADGQQEAFILNYTPETLTVGLEGVVEGEVELAGYGIYRLEV